MDDDKASQTLVQTNGTARPWVLAEAPYADVKQTTYDVAVLPMGATEPHNLHLPYGTDYYEGTFIGEALCGEAWKQGAKTLLLPTIPYGTETNMAEFPLAMNLNPSTLTNVIADLVESIERSGIQKMVILNSHGGNDFKPVLRELADKTSVHLFLCNWYACMADGYLDIFEQPEDHAGEVETSLIMHFLPHLVAHKPDGTLNSDAGSVRKLRFEALEKKWVSITRPWHLLTTNSGSGDPRAATPEKGRQAIERLCQRLVPFLVQLANEPVDDYFPFEKP